MNSGRRGEAEIENGPVDHFPAERTEQVLCTCETLNPEGLGLPQEAKKGRIAICYPSFFNSCGRRDLNEFPPPEMLIKRRLQHQLPPGYLRGYLKKQVPPHAQISILFLNQFPEHWSLYI